MEHVAVQDSRSVHLQYTRVKDLLVDLLEYRKPLISNIWPPRELATTRAFELDAIMMYTDLLIILIFELSHGH